MELCYKRIYWPSSFNCKITWNKIVCQRFNSGFISPPSKTFFQSKHLPCPSIPVSNLQPSAPNLLLTFMKDQVFSYGSPLSTLLSFVSSLVICGALLRCTLLFLGNVLLSELLIMSVKGLRHPSHFTCLGSKARWLDMTVAHCLFLLALH